MDNTDSLCSKVNIIISPLQGGEIYCLCQSGIPLSLTKFLKNLSRYFHETLYRYKSSSEDMQSALALTLVCIFLELHPFEPYK